MLISQKKILKKHKRKVLKNLTKDQSYYSKKNTATMGDSEYDVEVNAKSIAALRKEKQSLKKVKLFVKQDDDGFASEDERENYYLDLDDINEHGEDARKSR